MLVQSRRNLSLVEPPLYRDEPVMIGFPHCHPSPVTPPLTHLLAVDLGQPGTQALGLLEQRR
jgi:hypothetical protein